MNRPWHTWSIFGICLAVLLAAMGWVSLTAMRLDRAQEETAQQAEVEERVRLALWRMDAALAALVVEESARPYYAYYSFHATERAYTKGYTSIKQGDVLVPSPLLTYSATNVLLHFQFEPNGRLTSPQVPLGNERVLAEKSYVSSEKIAAASSRLSQLQQILKQRATPEPESAASSLSRTSSDAAPARKSLSNGDLLIDVCSAVPTNPANAEIADARQPMQQPMQQQERQSPQIQMLRNSAEWNARANASQQQAAGNEVPQNYIAPADLNLSEGSLKPAWLGPALVLARRVAVNGQILIQGCWLDWEQLRASLLGNVKDLFPAADLQPVLALNGENTDARRLAALPARLITGPVAVQALAFWSPIRFSLVIAWACVLLAAAAVAVLLNGALSLSERRGAFVSAVTH